MTDTAPPTDPRPGPEGVGSALRRGWRALNERTLVARKGGRDRMRLPLSFAAILALVLLSWSWPVVLAAVGIALVARVEFVVVREDASA
ncbi:MAG: hypothetical protein ABR510_01890 [Trueperaceae bacterium]